MVCCAYFLLEMRDLAIFYLYKSGMPVIDTCPMAELVTASDCYPTWDCSSEGREFEPLWGSSFFIIFSLPCMHADDSHAKSTQKPIL